MEAALIRRDGNASFRNGVPTALLSCIESPVEEGSLGSGRGGAADPGGECQAGVD